MLQYLLYRHTTICTLTVLCAVMCVVLIGFVGYHMWLIAQGTTTNESFKWRHILKCHAHMLQQRDWAMTAVPKAKTRAEAAEATAAEAAKEKKKGKAEEEEAEELCEKAVLLREEYEELAEEAKLLLELELKDMAVPVNRYNRGFALNFLEVLFPLCDRAAASAEGKVQLSTWPLPPKPPKKKKNLADAAASDEEQELKKDK